MSKKNVDCHEIMLIDDHPAVRQGVALLLAEEAACHIAAEADNRKSAIAFLKSGKADVAIIDISLGEESGLDLIPEIREYGVAVLAYSMHEDPETIESVFNAGALGYVTKRESSEVLLEAVAALLEGKRYVSPRCASSLASRVLTGNAADRESNLSDREKQVLQMLGRGETTHDIAGKLLISNRTVESYYSRIIEKLELEGMRELRRYVVKNNQL